MKFTSEMLMKAMELNVGDRVKVNLVNGKSKIYEVVKYTDSLNEEKVCLTENKSLSYLLNIDYEILTRPKRVGDLKCEELTCATCPLRAINCGNIATSVEKTLYQILGNFFPEYQDQEIYDLLKARLDKEVEE